MDKKLLIIGILTLAVIGLAGFGGYELLHARHAAEKIAAQGGQKTIYHCPMHPNYFSDKPGNCPICGMKLVPVNPPATAKEEQKSAPAGAVKIDPTVVQDMGVTTEEVQYRDLTKEIRASTTLQMNETAVSNVNAKIMGWVDKLYVDYTGQPVKRGQPLLTIYSPDLVSAQEEYLQALHYLNSLSGSATEARRGAQELVESSKRRLLYWDIPETEIERIASSGAPEKSLTIYSPSSGVVLEKMVVAGQNITPGMELYKVGDLSTVWAIANVFQENLPYITLGMKTEIDVSSLSGRQFQGIVQFIAPVLDPDTKTASVRIAIQNTADLALKPQMFVNIRILSPVSTNALSVSQQAVLHTGKRDVVIVSLGDGYFRPQNVTLGVTGNGYVQVLSGLTEGENIVTSSQFMIDAESNLKAAVGQMGGMEMPGMPGMEKPAPEKKGQDGGGMMNMPGM